MSTGACRTASPPAPLSHQIAAAEREIALREYRASESDGALQAPNRAHGLRTWFTPAGIAVHDRITGRPLFGMSLSGIGRGAAIAPVAAGALHGDGARVEIRRPALIEWYVNSPRGLEQGFTLEQRPDGVGSLVVEFDVTGAQPKLLGASVVIEASGRRLSYGELHAADATGRALGTHFEVADAKHLRLVIDETNARYPISIDPLLSETADTRLTSDQSSPYPSLFGARSAAGAGDVNGDGYADVIIGAHEYDRGQLDEGAAFMFFGSATGIADATSAAAATMLEGDQSEPFVSGTSWAAYFGVSVAGAGDVNGDGYDDVIVGAPGYNSGEFDEGAAFLFLGSASGIPNGNPSTAAARFESNQTVDRLGTSVAGAGDVDGDGYDDVIVGCGLCTGGSAVYGRAFIFHGSATGIANGNPGTAATRLGPDSQVDYLGESVAGAGDVNGDGYDDVIVGASGYDNGQTDEGAAFVFRGGPLGIPSGTSLTAQTRLESDQAATPDQYGNPRAPGFGGAVAGAGDIDGDGYDDVIVGAPWYSAGQAYVGAAFVFRGSALGIANGNPATAAARLESDQPYSAFGIAVDGTGDVNRDGFGDVIVGAPSFGTDYGSSGAGAAFAFLGSATGIANASSATAAAHLVSDHPQLWFGQAVAGAGDVNGDGSDDVLVGGYEEALVYLPEPGAALALAEGAILLLAKRKRITPA